MASQGFAPGRLAHGFENLLQPLDVAVCLGAMGFERLAKLVRVRRLGHLRQGTQNLLLGLIDVLEGLVEKIVEGLLSGGHGLYLSRQC